MKTKWVRHIQRIRLHFQPRNKRTSVAHLKGPGMLVAAPFRPSKNERVCPPYTRSNSPPVALLGCHGSPKSVGSVLSLQADNGASSLSQKPHPPRLQQFVKGGEAFLSGECFHLGQFPQHQFHSSPRGAPQFQIQPPEKPETPTLLAASGSSTGEAQYKSRLLVIRELKGDGF